MNGISGETQEERGRSEATIRFVVNGVNQLDDNNLYSAVTYIRHLPWQIFVRIIEMKTTSGDPPLEVMTKYLLCSVCCDQQSRAKRLTNNWSCNARVELTLVAQSATGHSIKRNFAHKYISAQNNGWGYTQFIAFNDLLKTEKGFTKDNTIVVEAKVSADRPYGVIMRSNLGNIFATIQRKSVDIYPELAYFMNESMSDVVFKVEGKPIPALKELLSVKCEYFRTMFSGNYTESEAKEIEIVDTTHEAFKTIIWYLYSNQLAVDSDDMLIDLEFQFEVYRLADRFQIKRLLIYYENQLKANITEENLELVSKIAFTYEINSLKTCVKAFIDKTFDKLILEDSEYLKKINGFTDDYLFDKSIESGRKRARNTSHQTSDKTMDWISGDTSDERSRPSGVITFVVKDVHQLNTTDYRYSAVTHVRHLPWQIKAKVCEIRTTSGDPPSVVMTKKLGCFVICGDESRPKRLPPNCSCVARVELTLVAQSATGRNITGGIHHKYISEEKNGRGCYFVAFDDLLNPEKGFIKDNTIVVEAKVSAGRPYGVIMRSNAGNIFGTIQRKFSDSYPELIYFMNQFNSNVVFKVEGKPIPAVKEFLSFKSDYFRSMFSGCYVESDAKEIEIQDTTYEAFKTIIWYLYSNQLAIDSDDMLIDLDFEYSVYRLADRFQIKRLLDYYENQLKSNITEENLELVSRIAFNYRIDSLMICVKKFIDKTFNKLILEDSDYLKKINGFTDDY
ncbi:unnamed protein product, partial [Medioppia subpectinata]